MGNYKLLAPLGIGGQSEVWSAFSAELTVVALKIFIGGHKAFEKAQKEYRISSSLKHSHILSPLSFFECEGYPVIVLPYCEGHSVEGSVGCLGESVLCNEEGLIFPETTASGIQLMSMNLLLPNATDPVVWRGSMVNSFVKKFWEQVIWDNVDFMFVDMPPGTGDVPLTVFQSLPLDGIVIVSSPQQLVRVIVEKAVKMAAKMNIPIIGLIENMSYVQCPDCNKIIKIFGESNVEKIAADYHIPLLAKIPMAQEINRAVDEGEIESLDADFMEIASSLIEKL